VDLDPPTRDEAGGSRIFVVERDSGTSCLLSPKDAPNGPLQPPSPPMDFFPQGYITYLPRTRSLPSPPPRPTTAIDLFDKRLRLPPRFLPGSRKA